MAARRFTEAQWRAIIQKFEDSNSTQEAFVNEHSIPLSSFRAWLYRLRKSKHRIEANFVEVRPRPYTVDDNSMSERSHRLSIEVNQGIRIIFDQQPPMQDLADLIFHLSSRRAC